MNIFLYICMEKRQSLNSIKKIQVGMMHALINGIPWTTTVSCYGPTNTSDETDIITFHHELSSLVWYIPKHNVLIIGGDMNAFIGKDENKFCFHSSSNRNRECLADFLLENKLACLNDKYQKWRKNYEPTPTQLNFMGYTFF